MSIFDGTTDPATGAVVVYPGDDEDPHRTHRCTSCGFLFGTTDPAQLRCGRPPCPSARQQQAAQQ